MTVKIGDMGHGPAWAGISHAAAGGRTHYALLQSQDGKYTLVNKASGGGHVGVRVDNEDVLTINDGGDLQTRGALRARNFSAVTAGDMGHAGWAGVSHQGAADPASYAVLQSGDGRHTLINKRPGPGHIGFRIGNVDKVVIDEAGRIGVGVDRPSQPLQLASGAYASAGGAWVNAASGGQMDNIAELPVDMARGILMGLRPVGFDYRAEPGTRRMGFVAEQSPPPVTDKARRGVGAMDVVAVLTKVVQDQVRMIDQLRQRIERLEADG